MVLRHPAFALAATLLAVLALPGDMLRPRDEPVVQAPAPAVPAEARAPAGPAELLASKKLVVPVHGVRRTALRDTFDARRGGGRAHEAIDILAPNGTPVLAAEDGTIARITSNRAGGLTVYQVDPSGRLFYYYAHLSGYAPGLQQGQAVRRGDVIGYVGTTGNAPRHVPHLHFAVHAVHHEGRWWKGEPLNPFDALVRGETVLAQESAGS